MKNLFEYTGCIHGHSIYSDGNGTYQEIIKDAKNSNLDFLLMSDHMTLKGKDKGFGGWHDNLFLHIGYEIQDPEDQHHYLAFGIDKVLPANLGHLDYIKEVEKLGALGIAAHPFEERDAKSSLPGYPPISWKTLDYPEVKVIELWNMMSHWMENTTLKNKYWNVIRPRSFATFPKKNLLRWWDSVNLTRKVTAVGSVDVHSTQVKILGIFPKSIFHYSVMFKSIRTYLLTEQQLSLALSDRENEKIIFDALSKGNSYLANIKRGDASGFRFWIESSKGPVGIGDEITAKSGILRVELPAKGFCKILCNGEVIKAEETTSLEMPVEPGIYRIEVEKQNRGWIFSNHIKIKECK